MKRLVDLTVDEVKYIITEIFKAKKVSNVKFNKHDDVITCSIYTEWGDDREIIKDDLTIYNPFDKNEDYIFLVDFPTNHEDVKKLRQFCYAKGVGGSMVDWLVLENPYMEK